MNARILLLLLFPFACLAQDKETNCAIEAKEIDSLVTVGNFGKAYAMLETTKCISQSHYFSAEKVLTQKLAAPATEPQKQKYLAELLKLYISNDKNFPGNKHSNLVKRAKALQQYKSGTPEDVFNLLDKAFKDDRDNFTDARGLYDYFELYFAKFKAGEKNFTEESLIEKQDEIVGRMNFLAGQNESERRNFQTGIDGIRAMTNPILTCEKLEAYYEKRHLVKKADLNWLAQATDNLISNNCLTTPTASKIAAIWHGLQPDARSAYAMGVVSLRSKENQADAFKYFNESAEKDKDAVRKSETYLIMASLFTSNDIPKAIDYVKKAIEIRPTYGKPYFLLAQLYVSTGCGETPFEEKALFTLAAETAAKAGVVEPSMKNAATATAARYLKKAPTQVEITEAKMAGKTITFGCGINQSVTFPK